MSLLNSANKTTVEVIDGCIVINGNKFPPVPDGGTNPVMINGKIHVGDYVFEDGVWKKSVRAVLKSLEKLY